MTNNTVLDTASQPIRPARLGVLEMERFKSLLSEIAVMVVLIAIVALFSLDFSSWRSLSVSSIMSKSIDFEVIASVCLLAVALMVFFRLRHKVAWMLVLFVFALVGLGVELPERFALHPEKISFVRVTLTLIVVLIFWLVEMLESKYYGTEPDNLREPGSYLVDDEIIKLNLDSDETAREVANQTKAGRS